jgi:hypothetical protein
MTSRSRRRSRVQTLVSVCALGARTLRGRKLQRPESNPLIQAGKVTDAVAHCAGWGKQTWGGLFQHPP